MIREFRITYDGKGVESHETLKSASRAFWVLAAHELKNGRAVDSLVLHGGKVMEPRECLEPGHWALQVLDM